MLLFHHDMRKYELMTILRTTLSEGDRKNFAAKLKKDIEDGGGKLLETVDMGKRLFTFPIQKQKEGFYTVFTFEMEGAGAKALETKVHLEEIVLRHLIIVLE